MALYFTKKRRWPPSKPTQYVLAVLGLIIAIVILSSWLIVRYHRSAPVTPPEQEPSTTAPVEKITEIGHSLLIFDLEGIERFVLIQTNPNTNQISVVPLPSNMTDDDDCLLSEAIHRHGAPQVTATVAETLDLPVRHYLSVSAKGIEQFLGQLDNGILFRIPEQVTFTDENGATIRLSAGEHRLSAGQVRSLLEYTGWKKEKSRVNLAADLTVAVLNQYLVEGRSLEGYFASLSNACVTDLRIDNFNAYRDALAQLAAHNAGNLCHRVDLPGTQKEGVFIPDLTAFYQESGLY